MAQVPKLYTKLAFGSKLFGVCAYISINIALTQISDIRVNKYIIQRKNEIG